MTAGLPQIGQGRTGFGRGTSSMTLYLRPAGPNVEGATTLLKWPFSVIASRRRRSNPDRGPLRDNGGFSGSPRPLCGLAVTPEKRFSAAPGQDGRLFGNYTWVRVSLSWAQ